ncbi:unnamed protein product [Penicillium pancosmium]
MSVSNEHHDTNVNSPPGKTVLSAMDRIQHIEDELAIRDLVARFANACSPPDYKSFAKLLVPDNNRKPSWILSFPFSMSATGVNEIVDMVKGLLESRDFFAQMLHSGVIEIDGDCATGRWIMHEIGKRPGESYYNNFAIYEDVMRKIDGSWFFSQREYKYMFLDSSSFEGQAFSLSTSIPKL